MFLKSTNKEKSKKDIGPINVINLSNIYKFIVYGTIACIKNVLHFFNLILRPYNDKAHLFNYGQMLTYRTDNHIMGPIDEGPRK